jgi:hypothetical protein
MPRRCRPNRERSDAARPSAFNEVTWEDIVPHLRSTLYITGAFCTAWSWDLAVYGASHVYYKENPLDEQLSFGNQRGPKHLIALLLQYLLVCGATAALSDYLQRKNEKWSQAAVTAVEFFPAPVFAGKLLGYLGQFSNFDALKRAIVNLAATWFAASLSHVLPMLLSHVTDENLLQRLRMQRFHIIVQNTLGFGLGISWNLLLSQEFMPDSYSRGSLDAIHFIGLLGYLVFVCLIAFRFAAEEPQTVVTIWDRQRVLLAFASYVVCAFTFVAFFNAILHPGWLGALESLGALLLLSAAMSAMVAGVDLDRMSSEHTTSNDEEDEQQKILNGPWGCFFGVLAFLPCTWFCCPWIPALWLLGTHTPAGVKEQWYNLIAMVAGLASSIEASSMLTAATDALSAVLGVCISDKQCRYPWLFVGLQVVVAVLTTLVLVPAIAPLSPEQETAEERQATDEEAAQPGERRSLLRRVSSRFRDKKKKKAKQKGPTKS